MLPLYLNFKPIEHVTTALSSTGSGMNEIKTLNKNNSLDIHVDSNNQNNTNNNDISNTNESNNDNMSKIVLSFVLRIKEQQMPHDFSLVPSSNSSTQIG